MRAVTIDYLHRDLRERDLTDPREPTDDEVLFQILEIGICGTDRNLASFRYGRGPVGDDFLVPGHEALGEVLNTGPAVRHLKRGDLVIPLVRRPCTPPCYSCERNRRDLCTSGNYTERGIMGAHGYFTEQAIDRETDLIRIDFTLRDRAVLLEPLSVVEKAVARALESHQGQPATALVLGAGTVGLLAAGVLRLRGLEVDLVSVEASGSRRASLAQAAEVRYLQKPDRKADIVIEAAGPPEAADVGLRALATLGVMVVLGAYETRQPAPLLNLILGNQTVLGSVNASPEHFSLAAKDLGRLPEAITSGLIQRLGFGEYRRTLTGVPLDAPKIVHVSN
ncbi:MAG: alcohol dehydrogenase catalytic domain-containing protein [Bryobacteraceae bacterium]|nr:alcohol dehydrogenase catalytic domain-containing protein [Bryobacteraceae bacterium]